MHSIGTVISYCTNDFRFIGKCIEEARKFSSQIVIAVCDHFFDGQPENRQWLEWTYSKHPDCQFIEFRYLQDRLYSRYHSMAPDDKDWAIYWAATTRYVGLHYLHPQIERVLFLDSDEILEGAEFLAWLDSGAHLAHDAVRLAAYLYAVKPNLQAKKAVNLPLFVKKETLAPLTLLNGLERIGAYLTHPGPKREEILGVRGSPMVHHYSWVRTKEECYRKAASWGHRHDADWPSLIEEAFNGKTENILEIPLEFEEIPSPFFDPFSVDFSCGSAKGTCLKIDDRDLFKKELELI